MKHLLLWLAVLGNICALAQEDKEWKVKLGAVTPNFEWQSKDEKIFTTKDLIGKIVLINFFATWCPPCREELPRVENEIWKRYQSRSDFSLLVFGREENWDKLNPFMIREGYTFPVFPDLKRGVFALFADSSIPRNIILNRKGEIIYRSIGYSAVEFQKMLDVLEKELGADSQNKR
ncbi:TlpA family protein disulfide reductase [Sphingobacterium sp. SYP-B4668]|uniref:TlpA family protein disulfide reductase n=1 Tax=Sphingobacterium sp. SYP-B4668 TaxID=2996035 RepID=UPI0022DE90AC|nr:TlpA disulfide reductase family protein [Sphingobacterium sp. SYP-B4668]